MNFYDNAPSSRDRSGQVAVESHAEERYSDERLVQTTGFEDAETLEKTGGRSRCVKSETCKRLRRVLRFLTSCSGASVSYPSLPSAPWLLARGWALWRWGVRSITRSGDGGAARALLLSWTLPDMARGVEDERIG